MYWLKTTLVRRQKLLIVLAIIALALAAAFVVTPIVYLSTSKPVEALTLEAARGYELQASYVAGTSRDGPWIVMVHGNRATGQQHRLYQVLLHHLDKRASVLALDLSGFGQSPADGLAEIDPAFDRSHDIETAIEFLVEQKGAKEEDVILIGHSLGAAQVLKVAQTRQYRLVIPIGFGDYSVYRDSQNRLQGYVEKIEGNTGFRVPEENMRRGVNLFTPDTLFTPCPETPTVLVFGAYEHGDALIFQRERLENLCPGQLRWITIPFADHMYGTESPLPRPFGRIYSGTMLTLLIRQLNSLIQDTTL